MGWPVFLLRDISGRDFPLLQYSIQSIRVSLSMRIPVLNSGKLDGMWAADIDYAGGVDVLLMRSRAIEVVQQCEQFRNRLKDVGVGRR